MNTLRAYVAVPYIDTMEDGTTTRNFAHISLQNPDSNIDRRRVKREVRKWVKRTLGRNIYTWELNALMKNVRWFTNPKHSMSSIWYHRNKRWML